MYQLHLEKKNWKKKERKKPIGPASISEIRLSQDKLHDTCTEVISSLLEGSKIYIAQTTVGHWPS